MLVKKEQNRQIELKKEKNKTKIELKIDCVEQDKKKLFEKIDKKKQLIRLLYELAKGIFYESIYKWKSAYN